MPDGPLNAGSEPLPALRRELLQPRDAARLEPIARAEHAPRILLLYGSLRKRSYSRLLIEEADRLLRLMGAETRIFDPRELPIANSTGPDHPKVQELRALSLWSEGQVWCSPEMHGAVTGVFKNQIDWLPLEIGSVRPTQGRTLAVMQLSGGSQSFNAVKNSKAPPGGDTSAGLSPRYRFIPQTQDQFQSGRRTSVSSEGPGGRPIQVKCAHIYRDRMPQGSAVGSASHIDSNNWEITNE
jgi:arsenic resistance protein ArsH